MLINVMLPYRSDGVIQTFRQTTTLSSTKMESSQTNHISASMIAQVKLEVLRLASKINHYTLQRNILIEALKANWSQIQQFKEL